MINVIGFKEIEGTGNFGIGYKKEKKLKHEHMKTCLLKHMNMNTTDCELHWLSCSPKLQSINHSVLI